MFPFVERTRGHGASSSIAVCASKKHDVSRRRHPINTPDLRLLPFRLANRLTLVPPHGIGRSLASDAWIVAFDSFTGFGFPAPVADCLRASDQPGAKHWTEQRTEGEIEYALECIMLSTSEKRRDDVHEKYLHNGHAWNGHGARTSRGHDVRSGREIRDEPQLMTRTALDLSVAAVAGRRCRHGSIKDDSKMRRFLATVSYRFIGMMRSVRHPPTASTVRWKSPKMPTWCLKNTAVFMVSLRVKCRAPGRCGPDYRPA